MYIDSPVCKGLLLFFGYSEICSWIKVSKIIYFQYWRGVKSENNFLKIARFFRKQTIKERFCFQSALHSNHSWLFNKLHWISQDVPVSFHNFCCLGNLIGEQCDIIVEKWVDKSVFFRDFHWESKMRKRRFKESVLDSS